MLQTVWRAMMALVLWGVAAVSQAAGPAFQEGVDYVRVEQAGATDDPATVEVREFFWFGCPHCFQFEGPLAQWRARMPSGVRFVRTPPAMNPNWEPHSRAYYIAEALGKQDAISAALFDAIHVKREHLMSEDELAGFFTRFDVKEDDFHQMYSAFSTRTRVNKAKTLAMSYQLTGVPCIIVNGKYKLELGMAKSPERLLQIVDFLIEKEKTAAAR